jgi:hypothetical protein
MQLIALLVFPACKLDDNVKSALHVCAAVAPLRGHRVGDSARFSFTTSGIVSVDPFSLVLLPRRRVHEPVQFSFVIPGLLCMYQFGVVQFCFCAGIVFMVQLLLVDQ